MWRFSSSYVGAPPGVEEAGGYASATADAYTYGGASGALSEGQAMQAWADLSQKQNTPQIKSVTAVYACPSGWLISPDGTTCVNQRNTHIALSYKDACDPSASNWYECSELPLWYQLHATSAFKSIFEAGKVLPQALRELGYLHPDGWNNVKASIHALSRVLARAENYQGGADFGLTEKQIEDILTNIAAPVYDDAIAKGGDVPTWVTGRAVLFGNLGAGAGVSLATTAIAVFVGAAGLAYFAPATASAILKGALALPAKGLALGRGALARVGVG